MCTQATISYSICSKNLMLEATGHLQKCRIYEMSSNKTLRATISYLIARDNAPEMAFVGKIFHGLAPSNTGEQLETTDDAPEGFLIDDLPDPPEEFAPGLTPELMELVMAASNMADPSIGAEAHESPRRAKSKTGSPSSASSGNRKSHNR